VLLALIACGHGTADNPVGPPTTDRQLYAAARVKYWTRYAGAPETISVFVDGAIPQTAEGADASAWTQCLPRQSPWPIYWNAPRLEGNGASWIDATAAHEVGHVLWDAACGCRSSEEAERNARSAAAQMLAGAPVSVDCRR